jgi:hypothetical protein
MQFTVRHDLRDVELTCRVVGDSSVSADIGDTAPLIMDVLGVRGLSQIFSAIVQRVAIFVIALRFVPNFQSKNHAVHQHGGTLSASQGSASRGVVTAGVRRPYCAPFPLREPREIGGIHFSALILS